MQSVCFGFSAPKFRLPSDYQDSTSHVVFRSERFLPGKASKFYLISSGLKKDVNRPISLRLNRGATICASKSNSETELKLSRRKNSGVPVSRFAGMEPFRGKSGSVSFYGLTHQLLEEGKLVSAPFQEDKGSFFWILAPAAFIASLALPQFFLGSAIEAWLKEETLIEITASLSFETIFYIGLATFLSLTDRVQKPYLQFSAKRWSLITGLRGYLTSAFFTAGFKVIAPLFAVYVTWPVLGLQALVAVFPFLVGCAVQLAFETRLDKRGSSCWPLVPIIFEVYRLYQLTRATQYIQRLMFLMKDAPMSPKLGQRASALVGMVVTFQVLAVVCLWSLMTFLVRLFPSRPVAENY